MNKFIPVNKPLITKEDANKVYSVLKDGWVSSEGSNVKQFEKNFSNFIGHKYSVAVSSGTAALEIAVKSLNLKKGDEVIIPNFTIISNALAVIKSNLKIKLIDCELKNWNMDFKKVIAAITNNTKAIIVTHIYNFPFRIDLLRKICKKKKIFIIEDAAESLGSKFKKLHTGVVGDMGIISFNGNKIITGGGGGIVLSNNKKRINKIKYLINQAKDDPVKFIHNESGFNLRINNLQSAIIYSQLIRIKDILKKKIIIHNTYKKYLNKDKISLISNSNFNSGNYWINVAIINKDKYKNFNNIVKLLIKNDIEARYVWYPNHLQKPFKSFQKYKINNALSLVKKSICLPSSLNLKRSEIYKICQIVNSI